MINNIFNQFDPNFSILNLFLLIFLSTLLTNNPNINPSLSNIINLNISINFLNENSNNLLKNNNNINSLILISIIIFISIINLLSLSPFSWSNTSHPSINIQLILILWLPILFIISTNYNNNFLIHLIPPSTPNLLIPFIFIIELISFLIRPLTLTIRLTANIIAGHIIVSLTSNLIINTPLLYLIPSIALLLLTIIELIVAILQAYIIITLSSMFISEI